MTQLDDKILDAATQWFASLQSPELSDADEAQFFAWLKSCDDHQRAYIQVERLWAGLEGVEGLTTNESLPQNENATVVAFPRKRRWTDYPQAIAASVAIFVAAFMGIMYFDTQQGLYQTAIGEQREIRLEDGSEVTLNTGSNLKVEFTDSNRIVELRQGEAFFIVAKNAERPFIVKSAGGLVRVVGTQFNMLSRAGNTEVTVVEGKVAIAPVSELIALESKEYQPTLTLVQDQQVILQASATEYVPTPVDAAATAAWRTGKLIYKGETLEHVLLDISRYFEGEIRVGDPLIQNLEVTAIFQLQDKAATIKALEATFNVAAVEASDELTLILPGK